MAQASITPGRAQTIGRDITESVETQMRAGSSLDYAFKYVACLYGDTMMSAWMQDMVADLQRLFPTGQFPHIEAVLKSEHADREDAFAQASAKIANKR